MWVWHSGDGCDLTSTLCKYDLRKADLFVLGWAIMRRVKPLFRAATQTQDRQVTLLGLLQKRH